MGKPFLFCMLKPFFYSFILIAKQNYGKIDTFWRGNEGWSFHEGYAESIVSLIWLTWSVLGPILTNWLNKIKSFFFYLFSDFVLFIFWCSYTYFMQIYNPNNVHFQFQLDTFFLIQKYTNNIPDWKQRHKRKNIMTPSSKLLAKSAFIKLSYLVLLGYLKYKVPVDDYSTAVTSCSIKEAELNCSMLLFLKKIN